MKKEVFVEECIDKMSNDTYFSEIVKKYNDNKTKEGFIDICKVLNYRNLYIGISFDILNKKLLKKLKKESYIPLEELENTCEKEPLKVNNPFEEDTYFICIFTDTSKINFNNMPINGIQICDLKQLWEEFLCLEENEGIVINPEHESIIIDKEFLIDIINNDYSKIEITMTLLDRLNNMNDEEDIMSILNEYLGKTEEELL